MKKFIILLFGSVLIFSYQSNAQVAHPTAASPTFQPTPHVYYMYISGITKGEEVAALEDLIQHKSGVTYFLSNRFPVRYFLLKSMNPVTQSDVESWIGNKYKIEFFGLGEQAKEGALIAYFKSTKK
jgi:hypothetical protein